MKYKMRIGIMRNSAGSDAAVVMIYHIDHTNHIDPAADLLDHIYDLTNHASV